MMTDEGQQLQTAGGEDVWAVDAPLGKLTRAQHREHNRAQHAAEKRRRQEEAASRARVREERLASAPLVRKGPGARFEPTLEQKRIVGQLSGVGCTKAEIISCIPWSVDPTAPPIGDKLFDKHFSDDFNAGKAKAAATLKRSAFDLAIREGSLAAIQFSLRSFHGLRDGTEAAPQVKIENGVHLYLPAKAPLTKVIEPSLLAQLSLPPQRN